MTVRIPVQGQRILLDAAVGKRPQGDLDLRLFRNPVLDLGSLTEGDFDEVEAEGYAARPLDARAWRAESGANPAALVHPSQVFIFGEAAGLVRGYFITVRADRRLVWFELFPKPVNGRRRGDRVTVTPRFSASSA